MNIMSALVGISIMGAAAPSMMQMSLAPIEAQVRAKNFSLAESAAVAFSAANEGQDATNLAIKPDNCDDPVMSPLSAGAWDITCWGGESITRGDPRTSKFYQEVTRSYRLNVDTGGSLFNWDEPIPGNIGAHQCPGGDNWGFNVRGFNEIHGDAVGYCVPRVAWTERQYLDSDPENWVYDLREFAKTKDYATHPAFVDD